MLSQVQKTKLREWAKKGLLPIHVPCPVGCKFCYHLGIEKIFNSIVPDFIPKYDSISFNYWYNQLIQRNTGVQLDYRIAFWRGKILYGPSCDFFNAGLTLAQIEKILRLNQKHNSFLFLYTTGLGLEPKSAEYISRKYHRVFSFWLSVITFNDALKSKLITHWVDSAKLKKIIGASINSRILLLHFNKKQTISDLKVINSLKPSNPCVVIYWLYYNRAHPDFIIKLAEKSYGDFKDLVVYLMKHRSDFKNIAELSFHSPSEAHAWKHRTELKRIFSRYDFGKDDIMLCSKGAFRIINFILNGKARVFYVENFMGSSVDMTTAATARNVVDKIDELIGQGLRIKKVFVPNSIWWINGKHDFDGNTAEFIRKRFPQIKLVLIQVPENIFMSGVSLETCHDYYNSDLERTKNIFNDAKSLQALLNRPECRFYSLTKARYIRQLSVGLSANADLKATYKKKDCEPLWEKDPLKQNIIFHPDIFHELMHRVNEVTVTYCEPTVIRSGEIPSDKVLPFSFQRKRLPVKLMLAGQLKLKNETAKILFQKLFVENKSIRQTLREMAELFPAVSNVNLSREIKMFYNRFSFFEGSFANVKKDL